MESHLVIKNINVTINKKAIVKDATLSINKGEVVGLIGENGAGKSTLLRILGLLEKPQQGQIYFNDVIVESPNNARKDIAFVFQDNMLFKGSVRANIAYPLKLRKLPTAEIDSCLQEVIAAFGLNSIADQDARTLSGGEAKKISLARALVYGPSVLLLDEPFNNLDQIVRKDLKQKVFDYVRKHKISTVIVSHDFDEIVSYCQSLAVMHKGQIIQRGSIEEIMSKPADKQVASILGNASIIEGEIEGFSDQAATVKVGDSQFVVASNEPMKVGQRVFLNIRPEDIFISNNGAFKKSSVRNSFQAKIANIENKQSFSKLRLQNDFISEANITKQSVEELDLYEGKTITAGFKATAVKIMAKHSDD